MEAILFQSAPISFSYLFNNVLQSSISSVCKERRLRISLGSDFKFEHTRIQSFLSSTSLLIQCGISSIPQRQTWSSCKLVTC
ncbi:hypothetical protein PanWU01x14_051430 [Parasponia andersonii]|uniref:Uncharacterized protein n=1 Tax=Parasponia andersonii TaxID=3476 RepID=A0A2P5DLZ1_PARAD|nr:hypothetical protein PanWU01x14_051430 [Parasponia andersonii]